MIVTQMENVSIGHRIVNRQTQITKFHCLDANVIKDTRVSCVNLVKVS